MLKIVYTEVLGFDQAIYSMRNPKNSWARRDSWYDNDNNFNLGEKDLKLATTLANAGTEHGKYLRMINVYFDVIAPLYWYKEMDTYKVGTVCNSCSTMHKIHAKQFEKKDFSTEHLFPRSKVLLARTIEELNFFRNVYINGGSVWESESEDLIVNHEPNDKDIWWQLIQLLPSCYNQRRTYMMNYATLKAIYHQRKNHKLDEWHTFCEWIETLPYAKELIIGEE